jgi:hypothetical protein
MELNTEHSRPMLAWCIAGRPGKLPASSSRHVNYGGFSGETPVTLLERCKIRLSKALQRSVVSGFSNEAPY